MILHQVIHNSSYLYSIELHPHDLRTKTMKNGNKPFVSLNRINEIKTSNIEALFRLSLRTSSLAFIAVDGVEAKIVHYQEENAESK